MGIGLSYPEVGLLKPYSPDFGQVFYMVDSSYRTGPQGWSKSDRTGPLDLFEARKAGQGGVQYVFRTGDFNNVYATAMQAAIDAAVDFRGDAVFFTNGTYLPATAVNVDVPDLRLLGRPVPNPTLCGATISAASITNALTFTAAADRVELGFLRLVPITAAPSFLLATGSDNHYWHDFFMDAAGVATSASTVPVSLTTTSNNSVFTKFRYVTDDQQGAMFTCLGAPATILLDTFDHFHIAAGAGAVAVSLVDIQGTTAAGTRAVYRNGRGYALAGGTVTAGFKCADSATNTVNIVIENFKGSKGYSTAAGLHVNGGAAAEANLIDCYLGVDEATAGASALNGSVLYTS